LVQSNTPDAIEKTTKKAYAALWKSKTSHPDAIPALKVLVGLKGVGPATASLLLSVLRPAEIPFFSDELFRWCVWDEELGGAKENKGWHRKIKYNIKEYEMLLERVDTLRSRLRKGFGQRDATARAMDIENVAWVLGKEGVDVGVQDSEGEDEGTQADKEREEQNVSAKKERDGNEEKVKKLAATKGTKRKASGEKQPTGGTRKSKRTRK
jgi:hypothetical protein